MRLLLTACLLSGLLACSGAAPPEAAGPIGWDDELCELPEGGHEVATEFVSYGTRSWQRAAVVRPTEPGSRPRPAILFVHGGGWVGGNLHEHLELAAHYASRGWVAISVTYKLATDGPSWPQPAVDIGCALAWAQAEAGVLDIDPDNITLFGTSAGGHLVSLVGVGAPSTKCGQAPPRRVVAVSAPSALLAVPPADRVYPRISSLLGGSAEEVPTHWREASADQWVPSVSPMHVVHAARDKTVAPQVAEAFVDALVVSGSTVDHRVLMGVGHGFERHAIHRNRLQCYLEPILRPTAHRSAQ